EPGRARGRRRQRQAHREGGALARRAGEADRAAVGVDDPARDRQTEAGAAAPTRAIGDVKLLEDMRAVRGLDARPLVMKQELRLAVDLAGVDRDRALRRRQLQRVV